MHTNSNEDKSYMQVINYNAILAVICHSSQLNK